MVWDEDKSPGDLVASADWDSMVTDQKTRAPVSNGSGAPSSTPSKVGALYIDTTNSRVYVATGTSGSGDWKEVLISL